MALSLKAKKILVKLGVVVCLLFIITGFTIIKFAAMLVPTYIELVAIKSALFVHFNADNIMLHVSSELAKSNGNGTYPSGGGSGPPPSIDFSNLENVSPEIKAAVLSYPEISVLTEKLETAFPLIGSAILCCAIGFTFLKVVGGVYVCYVKPLVKAEKEEEQLEILLAKSMDHQKKNGHLDDSDSKQQKEAEANGVAVENGHSDYSKV